MQITDTQGIGPKYLLPLIFVGCFTIALLYKSNVSEDGQPDTSAEISDIIDEYDNITDN